MIQHQHQKQKPFSLFIVVYAISRHTVQIGDIRPTQTQNMLTFFALTRFQKRVEDAFSLLLFTAIDLLCRLLFWKTKVSRF